MGENDVKIEETRTFETTGEGAAAETGKEGESETEEAAAPADEEKPEGEEDAE